MGDHDKLLLQLSMRAARVSIDDDFFHLVTFMGSIFAIAFFDRIPLYVYLLRYLGFAENWVNLLWCCY